MDGLSGTFRFSLEWRAKCVLRFKKGKEPTMKAIFFSTAAIFLAAAPAQAQLLGGTGLGGQLGGTLNGAGSLSLPTRSVDTITRGAGSVRGATEGSQSVDRKSGQVSTRRSASAQGSGSVDQTVAAPFGSLTGSASGNGQASGSGQADAQLLGTDAVRGIAGTAVGTMRGAASQAGGISSGIVGSLSGAATGTFSGAAGQLALAGSAAGQAAGSFDIARGMPVSDDDGERIGTVSNVITNARGQVQQVVVMTEDGLARVPAANFTGEGSLLISAMSEGRLEKTARQQEKLNENPDRAE